MKSCPISQATQPSFLSDSTRSLSTLVTDSPRVSNAFEFETWMSWLWLRKIVREGIQKETGNYILHIYCAWLIKWLVKRETIQLAELYLTRWWMVVLDGTGSVYDDTGWYLVSISWYCLALGGTGLAKGLYACIGWKKGRFGQLTPIPHTLTHSLTDNRI